VDLSRARRTKGVGALSRLVEARELRPQVEAVLPLEQVRDALERVAGRHTRGKVVLQIGQ
jgi:NADPH:quinone reductase